MRYLPVWSASCTLSQDGRWLREAHRFCISILDLSRKELWTTRKGRSVFGVKHFHQYLYGRRFVIYSDHKPLKHLFSKDRPVPQLASACIQRWAHLLSAYDYSIAYRPGSDHANADLLSRLPLPEAPAQVPVLGDTILLMDTLEGTPVTASHIRTWTSHDQVLSTVLQKVQKGWKGPTDDVLQPYARRMSSVCKVDVSCGGIESSSHHKVEARSLMSCMKVTQG